MNCGETARVFMQHRHGWQAFRRRRHKEPTNPPTGKRLYSNSHPAIQRMNIIGKYFVLFYTSVLRRLLGSACEPQTLHAMSRRSLR